MDRILDATERLLDDVAFDDLSINDVIAAAGSSAGAFYTRFSGKEALLDALYDRHQERMMGSVAVILDPAHWRGASVADIVRGVVRFTLALYREHRGLYRSLVLRGFLKPDARYQDATARRAMPTSKMGALIASRAAEIDHPDPRTAGAFGFVMMLATLREQVLFSESTARSVRLSRKRLEDELVRAYLGYLGAAKSSSKKSSAGPARRVRTRK